MDNLGVPTHPGRNPLHVFVVTAISAWALYLRLMHLHDHELWFDEYYQLDQMRGSFWDMMQSPRLFSYLSGDSYLIYPFFKVFSYDKWGLAIPHILSTLLGFYLLYLMCRRYLKTIYGYAITFTVVCFNATLIEHATEIRPYAVLPTLALASLYVSLHLVDHHAAMSARKKFWIGAFFTLVLLFHVYGALILFCPLAFALWTRRGTPSFKAVCRSTAMILAVVLGIAVPIWALSLFGSHLPWQGYGFKVNDYIPYPFEDAVGFLKRIFGNLVGHKVLYVLLPGAVISFFLPHGARGRQAAFLTITVFIPIGLILLADVSQNYFFVQRQFIWVMPLFALFLGWSWESLVSYLLEKRRRLPARMPS